MSAYDRDAIAVVAKRIHKTGIDGKRRCRCEVCRALRRVLWLADESTSRREALSAARGFAARRAVQRASAS